MTNNLKLIATLTLSRIANAIREKDPDLGDPQMTPLQMPSYILSMDLHGYEFGGEGGAALNFGTNLRAKFQNNALKMYPIISNQVTDMQQAFNNCRLLAGTPMCNDNVIYGQQMYRDCWNLTGEPQTGNNLQDMSLAYYNCINITGNAPIGPNVTNASQVYFNCSNLNGEVQFRNCNQILNIRQGFYNCSNLGGIIPKNIGPVQDAYQAFWNCQNIGGNAIVGDLQADMSNAYYNCFNISGNGVSGPNVTNMIYAFHNCTNLNGTGACGPKVTTIQYAYLNCYNLGAAAPNCPNVTGMYGTYWNCYNMSLGYVGPKVTDLRYTFAECRNMKGSIILTITPTYTHFAFQNCEQLQGVYSPSSPAAANAPNMFLCPNRQTRLNVVFGARAGLTASAVASVCGCTFPAVTVLDANNKVNVRLPLTYENGAVYGNKYYECIAYTYNEEYNIYLYSVA